MRTAHVPADFYFRGHDSSWYGRIVPCGKTQFLTLGRNLYFSVFCHQNVIVNHVFECLIDDPF